MAVGFYALGAALGLTEYLSTETLQIWMRAAGLPGAIGFIAIFAVGNLLGVPGLVFIVASLLAYGKGTGMAVALLGSLAALTLNFWTVRLVGGSTKAPEAPTGWTARVLGGLSRRPVRTVFVLRNLMILSPPLNYALALSSIRYRDYMAGSTLGLLAPIGFYALFLDRLAAWGLI